MATKIKEIKAREILDSCGLPTVEVLVILDNGLEATASVSSGEDNDKRDNDNARYFGQGVKLVLKNIDDYIAPVLIGLSPLKQSEIDKKMIELDGTDNKQNLGANTILAVSLAVARAAAKSKKQSLHEYLNEAFFDGAKMSMPSPIVTMFNGGRYGDTNLDFEEYLLVLNNKASRFGAASVSFSEMLRAGTEIYHSLGEVLKESGYDTDTGLEGGYAPDMDSSIQALEIITAATISAGYDPKLEARLGIDIGSATLYNELEKKYVFALDSNHFSSSNLIGLYNEWLCRFPLVYLEDPVAPDDSEGWRQASEELGAKLILAGSNLFASQSERLRPALKEGIANTIVIIPSSVGTLTESIECLKLARRHNYKIVIGSCRGETNDDFMADLAVASAADYFKGGAPARGERVAKWNRLLILENILYGHK